MSPLRSDGSRDDQAGEAGLVEQSSAEAKSLKTKGQGTVRLPPQWAKAEAARLGPEGQIKGLLPRHVTKRKQSLKHMIWKQTVNVTIAKGHHAQTRCTARKILMFHTIAVRLIKIVHYYC